MLFKNINFINVGTSDQNVITYTATMVRCALVNFRRENNGFWIKGTPVA